MTTGGGQQVLSSPAPGGGARYDLTRRPGREELGLQPGARTNVVGKSSDGPFTATLITDAGEVATRSRTVVIDSEAGDGPVAQLVVQLVRVPRSDTIAQLRASAPVLGLDLAKVNDFDLQAAQARAAGSTDTRSTDLRGGTTGGGQIEVVLRHDPTDDTVFENLQVTWPP